MANYYVRSLAGGAGTGADWANAFTTLTAAVSGKAAGDVFFVSEDHAESSASAVTITFPGTLASPNFIYCVNHLGSVPPVSADLRTTGTVTTTGASTLTVNGVGFYLYGLTFVCGSSGTPGLTVGGSNSAQSVFEACAFQTAAGNQITLFGSASGKNILNNCTFQFVSVNSSLRAQGIFYWYNTGPAITGATFPTTFIIVAVGEPQMTIQGVDLSGLGAGKTLVGNLSVVGTTNIIDCKLGGSVTVSATPAVPAAVVNLIRGDSGATNYRTEAYRYEGTQTTETTIVRTGGATDGTTSVSWKIVTTANSKWVVPFESLPISIWNSAVGASKTITVCGIWGSGAVPNNDDIWLMIEYLGSASFPQGSVVSTTKSDNLAAGSAVASDSSTWGGSTTPFKLVGTITPQMAGPINIVVRAAKPSTTFYIDPLITIT